MPFLELFDETLDINSTANYDLSLQVSPDGLTFCLLDSIRNKFVLFRSFGAEENLNFNSGRINEIIGNDDFLTKHYRKVKCVMPTLKFTLVPAPLYDPGKKDEYFSFNHSIDDGTIILADRITDPDAFLLYPVSKSMAEVINGYYPGVHPHHSVKMLLEQTCSLRKSTPGKYICIHVEKDFFNLIVFDNNQLKFCNSFTYRNVSDIVYYVMNAFKNLDISQEETAYLSGLTERYDDLSSGLSMYIRNIKYAEPSGNFTFSYVFNDTELHKFINLYTLTNCE
jgi:hypothetical protein